MQASDRKSVALRRNSCAMPVPLKREALVFARCPALGALASPCTHGAGCTAPVLMMCLESL